jgi:GDPmannose 4,6-dehydratase
MTRAFVTGIGGQDGSYLAEQLIADGVEVHALAHVEEGRGRFCPGGVVVHEGDLADVEGLRRLLLDLAPDELYNLAAISSVAQSWELPDLTSLVNGSAAVALLETAHRVQERTGRAVRMVQASSAEIFGEPDRVPQDEDTRIRPLNPYGAAKAYTHLMVDVYRTRDLHASAVILYNHESPRRPPRFVTRKITSTVAAIASGAADTLTLGNLDVRRDWGWAPDYADAMVRAARAEQAQDFVIATGHAHSVRDFVAAAFDHVGITDWESLVTTDPGFVRPADASEMVGDASRAHRELGWQPTVGFAELVGRMVQADLDAPT